VDVNLVIHEVKVLKMDGLFRPVMASFSSLMMVTFLLARVITKIDIGDQYFINRDTRSSDQSQALADKQVKNDS
jgi:hypothetical protein